MDKIFEVWLGEISKHTTQNGTSIRYGIYFQSLFTSRVLALMLKHVQLLSSLSSSPCVMQCPAEGIASLHPPPFAQL